MKVGEVNVKDGKANVIVEIRSDGSCTTIPLEKYVMRNTTIKVDGEYLTIEELINERCESYMNGVKVYE